MKDLLTIPELAEATGKKKQGLYEQSKNKTSRLYPYVVEIGTKTYIRSEALKELYGIVQDETPKSQESQGKSQGSKVISQESQPESQVYSQVSQDDSQATSQESQESQVDDQQKSQVEDGKDDDIVSFLKEQLREKDRQLAVKDEQINGLQQLLSQEQALHARTNLLLAEYQRKEAEEEEHPEGETEEAPEAHQEDEEPRKQHGWLYRFFFGDS